MTTRRSAGPWAALRPGDSLRVVFGVVCARKAGSAPARDDTREQRQELLNHAALCQQAYDGEDANGNNRLDPGEDLNGNGRLDHYQLPQPPRPPKVRVALESQTIAVYWDRGTSELSLDPISKTYDFEGYRVYRSNPGSDVLNAESFLLDLSMVGEFDIAGNDVGYNTGFGRIRLAQAKQFPGDTVQYWYRFPPADEQVTHLNGWQYVYGVSAFDRGAPEAGVAPLESKAETRRVVPGTVPAAPGAARVGVYPNPYYAGAAWDGPGERLRKIYFTNLPRRCEIRVYTLAGDVVDNISHDGDTYGGADIEWFRQFGGPGGQAQLAGGEHAWDLISKFDQAIATGLYLYSVKDTDTGEIQTGKFLVVK